MRDLAKKYGVSDVALAKTCRRLLVPVPGRSYWATKSTGEAPSATFRQVAYGAVVGPSPRP